jgi:hypothetical protein
VVASLPGEGRGVVEAGCSYGGETRDAIEGGGARGGSGGCILL